MSVYDVLVISKEQSRSSISNVTSMASRMGKVLINTVYQVINSVYQVINSVYHLINSVYQPINTVYQK